MKNEKLLIILERAYVSYNENNFVEEDPIQIPRRFAKKQDIEIAGFFAATLAWGQRKSIIKNGLAILNRMDNSPYDYVLNATSEELKKMEGFVHRTFNSSDLYIFIDFFKQIYSNYPSLEDYLFAHSTDIKTVLLQFKSDFIQSENYLKRTGKHLSSPEKGSACKRLNMYFRWMTRKDNIDLGIWSKIKTSDLICPLDVHVIRVAKHFGLLEDEKANWKNAIKLTESLKELNPKDPIKYDIALFGLGVNGKY